MYSYLETNKLKSNKDELKIDKNKLESDEDKLESGEDEPFLSFAYNIFNVIISSNKLLKAFLERFPTLYPCLFVNFVLLNIILRNFWNSL